MKIFVVFVALSVIAVQSVPIPDASRTRRATSEANAASKVIPDGTIQTTADSKGSDEGHPIAADNLTKKLPEIPVDAGAPASTSQKVASHANMINGTAIATANFAKRSAILQNVDTSGGKAVANAEAHKGAEGILQAVTANGTDVGIANALADNKNASVSRNQSGHETVVQNVAASGKTAVATATNNKESGNSFQEAVAHGEEISIATASNSRVKRELIRIPVDGPYRPEKED